MKYTVIQGLLLSFVLLLSYHNKLQSMETPESSVKAIAEKLYRERTLLIRPLIETFIKLPETKDSALVKGYDRAKIAFEKYITERNNILSTMQNEETTIKYTTLKFFSEAVEKFNTTDKKEDLQPTDLYKLLYSSYELSKNIKPHWKKIKMLERNFEQSTGLVAFTLIDVTELTPSSYAKSLSEGVIMLLAENILRLLSPHLPSNKITYHQEEKLLGL